MKKSALAVLLAASMALSMTACGGSSNETTAAATEAATTAAATEAPAETEAEAEAPAETEAPAAAAGTPVKDPSEFKVGMVTDVGGVNDGSFNQSSWEGSLFTYRVLGATECSVHHLRRCWAGQALSMI